ncbi:ThiF family adenylyltransferase [Bacillus cihuensis]|uniref:ThiF family adenylyltransferase n=1 Tax=Bacillus cihuensis TaxID=1208599 RepID=UPI000406799C|nr:ThiF family adenylyltransferase [Bacillus cihuensis]
MSISILKSAKDQWFDYNAVFPFIVQIGTGGTGAYVVQHIAQLLGTSKQKAAYVIADPDVIEEKNLGNQLFLPEEVGLKKADVLASRYSAAYGIDIGSYSDSYIETPEQLRKLFSTDYMSIRVPNQNVLFLPIIIGCVDNNFSRQIIHELFSQMKTCIYIDAGNENVTLPPDWMNRPKEQWTEEEKQEFNESGWRGQVVTGVKLNLFKQGPIGEMFPDVLEDQDELRPSELSCTQISASEPQRLIVNKFAALIIANIMTQIVEDHHTISSHIVFFHAKQMHVRAVEAKQS